MASHISPSKMETKASSSTAQDFIDYGDVCRICGSDENSLNLIGIYSNEGLGDDLPTKINTYLPVTVASTDDLPLQCCTKCVSTLNSWHVFVNNSVEADSKWKNFHVLASSSNKLLNEEEGDDGIGDRDDDQSELDDDMPLSELVETKQEPEDDDDCFEPSMEFLDQIKKEESSAPEEHQSCCETCGLSLINRFALNRHMFAEHGQYLIAPYPTFSGGCKVRKALGKTKIPARRNRRPTIPKLYSCSEFECDTKFSTKAALKRHVMMKHPKEPEDSGTPDSKDEDSEELSKPKASTARPLRGYKCSECDFKSPTRWGLKQHKHTGERPYLCKTCGMRFFTKPILKKHELTHLPPDQRPIYECNICQKRLSSNYTLGQHVKTHSTEHTYVCDLCGVSCKIEASLRVHKMTYHNDNMIPCTICGFLCFSKTRLKVHMNCHQDIRNYECSHCGKGFKTTNERKRHEMIHTVQEREHQCSICQKTFALKRYLNNHMLITHKLKAKDRPSTSKD